MSAWLPWCDKFSGWIIYGMVLFSPWAFGTTQPWAVSVMNGAGYTLGLVWLGKYALRTRSPKRDEIKSLPSTPRWFTVSLATLTLLLLGYVIISALNARATYLRAGGQFEYHSFVNWLPHSYDRAKTWQWFWNYLALAASFWAIRDWLTDDQEKERGEPPRWHRLLWVVSINGALLALQGLLQRADGTTKLLWLVEPRVNKSPEHFFGPFAYRANAAQFFNLIWPLSLALWSDLQRRSLRHRPHRFVRLRHALLPCAALTALAPVVSGSRGGAMVTGLGVLVACGILFGVQKRSRVWQIGVASVGILILCLGWVLAGKVLEERMTQLDAGFEERENMFKTARAIADEYPLFGTGPGSFEAIFQLYRSSPEEYWPAQLHNDWLETLLTFGWVGSLLVWSALALVFLRPFLREGGHRVEGVVPAFLFLSVGSCLLHARYDFPFQIYSILFLVLLSSALLSCVSCSRKRTS